MILQSKDETAKKVAISATITNVALRATGNQQVANMISNTVAIYGTAVNAFMAGNNPYRGGKSKWVCLMQ